MISTFCPHVCITISSFSCLLVPFRFEYLFNFDNTFEIHDDIEVLKRMGMSFGLEKGQCEEANLRTSRTMVPKALEPYVMGKTVERFICEVRMELFLGLLLLSLLLLSLRSQSLLVVFFCISQVQTIHLGHQSLNSIILFIHYTPF